MDFWPRGIEKVKKFNIVVGDYFGGIPDPRYSLSNKLDLQGQNLSDIETRFDLLLKRTEILILTATAVSLKILCDLVDEDGFECLMKLTLDYLTELEYLINTTDGVPQSAFPSGLSLHLHYNSSSASSMADLEAKPPLSPSSTLEKQFEDFRHRLEESESLRERIRAVAREIESVTRLIYSCLLLVHQSRPIPEKVKAQISKLKELFHRLAGILRECPGSIIGGVRHYKAVNTSEFGLDIEDYLIGICFISNELPRYVVNQVTAGDYDCPRKVLKFLTDLHAAFRMLNLRNDLLRKKFDGMKYDLHRVEEVYYDVKIRGLTANGDSTRDLGIQGQS
ncbi:hypothetical protein TEA_029937 [Camellia sinensis var. sinensis]|uniref:Translin n=1 Tax=Camellia sinensis var. sinensis TaxID=542762 RepID=A0A4S4EHL5_CAMSN|nr:hypothetical protein TEA_029937 [Camellia sinensis var. sinensis]